MMFIAVRTPQLARQETSEAFSCVACGGVLSYFGTRRKYDYHRCRGCGTLQLAPLPSKQDLEQAYANEYAESNHISRDGDYHQSASRHYFTQVTEFIRQFVPSGRITEIGTGWGVLASMLGKAGYEYEGVELSDKMRNYCAGQGLNPKPGGIEVIEGKDRQAIVITNVFEHIVDHDKWLETLAARLETGCCFISSQPTAHFPYFFGTLLRLGIKRLPLPQLHVVLTPPWHSVLFSRQGMQTLLERHGFELVAVRPSPNQRDKGLTGLLQGSLEFVNRIGWAVVGPRWPLVICHIFVFKKR